MVVGTLCLALCLVEATLGDCLYTCFLGLSSYMFFSNGKMDDSDDINEETTKVRTHTLAQHAWILVLSAQLFFRETKHI